MWVPQWPLTKEKQEAVQGLIAAQVRAGHLRPSTSPWNTPIFPIKKKSGQWRLLQDLRAVNAQMQIMGPVQRGLPLLSALPQDWFVAVIDIKDCFFSIPLHPQDIQRFAFTVPSINQEGPDQRWEWVSLPQGMANSPTLCQLYVDTAIQPIRQKFPQCKCLHYMDDILITSSKKNVLGQMLTDLLMALQRANLIVASDKVQLSSVIQYLGCQVTPTSVSPLKIHLRRDILHTLNDFQKLLGDINWIRPYLHLTNDELAPLFEVLKGDAALTSERYLTPQAEEALNKVEKALSTAILKRWEPNDPVSVWVLPTPRQPTAVLWQGGPLLWVHPHMSPSQALEYYPAGIATLALEAVKRCQQHFGVTPSHICVPYTKDQIQVLAACVDQWAILLCCGGVAITNQKPKDPLLQFLTAHPVIFPKITAKDPLRDAPTVFTDGSKTGVGAYIITDHPPVCVQFQPGSPQIVELQIVLQVFTDISGPFNLLSDSKYVVNALQILEAAHNISPHSTVASLFVALRKLISQRSHPFYAGHIRAHSTLPGPLVAGNALADSATRPIWTFHVSTPIQLAAHFHNQFHVNSRTLAQRFKITRADARDIVRQCPQCPTFTSVQSFGVNPRGLLPGQLWQMDVTHIPEFGSLKYVHVSVDTCSQIIFASAETGEKVAHVISHCLAAWAAWGKPAVLKTDNGPAYISKSFQQFCSQMQLQLKHGIPYNPQGQGIIERAHRSLKLCLQKQKEGVARGKSPRARLSLALFTLNFLNLLDDGRAPADRHAHHEPSEKGMVKWKDILTGQWMGPDPVVSWSRGAVCVFPQDPNKTPVWVPERLVRKAEKPSTDPSEQKADPSNTPEDKDPTSHLHDATAPDKAPLSG